MEKTLTITGLKEKTNGYCVVVGIKKGMGSFRYIIGNKKQAQQLGEEMKEVEGMLFKQQNQAVELFIDLKPVALKECNLFNCKRLTEINEPYCLRCEDCLADAQADKENLLENYNYG